MIEHALMTTLAAMTPEEFVTVMTRWTPFEALRPDDLKVASGYLTSISQEEYKGIKDRIYALTIEEIFEFILRSNPPLFQTIETLVELKVQPGPINYIITLLAQAARFILRTHPPLPIPLPKQL